MQDVDARGLPEQLAGEMLGGAEAGAGERDLAGIGLGDAISALTSLAGKSGRATMIRPAVATSDTGSNAVSVS